MSNQRGRAVWSVVTAVSVAFSLWSLVPAHSSSPDLGCCLGGGNCTIETNSTCLNGNFSPGQTCSENATCVEPLIGCCESGGAECAGGDCLGLAMCHDNITELDCFYKGGDFVEDAVCETGSRATTNYAIPGRCVMVPPPPPATPTATPTRIPDGGSCVDPMECVSDNCVEDVCCDTACDGPGETCSLAGSEGTCLAPATMAPTASNRGLGFLIVALAALGVVMMVRRRDLGTSVRSFFSL